MEYKTPFLQAVFHLIELGEVEFSESLFEVSHASVHEFGTFAGCFCSKISPFYQRHLYSPESGVECAACACGAAANDTQIKGLLPEKIKLQVTVEHTISEFGESGLPVPGILQCFSE
jgi:hypothetical protein